MARPFKKTFFCGFLYEYWRRSLWIIVLNFPIKKSYKSCSTTKDEILKQTENLRNLKEKIYETWSKHARRRRKLWEHRGRASLCVSELYCCVYLAFRHLPPSAQSGSSVVEQWGRYPEAEGSIPADSTFLEFTISAQLQIVNNFQLSCWKN